MRLTSLLTELIKISPFLLSKVLSVPHIRENCHYSTRTSMYLQRTVFIWVDLEIKFFVTAHMSARANYKLNVNLLKIKCLTSFLTLPGSGVTMLIY